MSAHANPDIVDDNLVFMYDTDDGKSYKGEPTVNLVGNMTKRFNNWNGLTGTSEYYTTSEGNQGVKVVTTSGTGGVQWYTNSTIYNIQASTEYTISATVKYLGGTPHPNLLYVRQYDGDGQTSESGKFTTANQKDLGGDWKRIWRTFTTDSTTTHINLQGYQYYSGRTIYIQDLQFESKSHATQFAGASTTRSATQGLIDRTGTSTINISNASFDSNAEMTFDGTDDIINTGLFSGRNPSTDPFTVEAVVRSDVTSGNKIWIDATSNGSSQRFYSALIDSTSHAIGIQGSAWSDPTPGDTNWHHQVIVMDGSTAKAYNNGELASSKSYTSYTLAGGLNIGGRSGYNWVGQIPIFKIYDRALTAAEVLQNYNATKSRFSL